MKRTVFYVTFILLLLTGFAFQRFDRRFNFVPFDDPEVPTDTATAVSDDTARVKRVIDGDTIELDDGQKVRYIGIDAPEEGGAAKPGCFGPEAADYNKTLVEGKLVRLEKDASQIDKYGRLLRYLYVPGPEGEIFVNLELVRQGFARAAAYPPDIKYQNIFDGAQSGARQNSRGLWSACPRT